LTPLAHFREVHFVRFKTTASILVVALLSVATYGGGNDDEKKRDKSRKMADQTLQDLYKLEPSAQATIKKSAGYAVFNNTGANLLLLSTARGAGIAMNNSTKQETFMKMISAGAGLGFGVKSYRVIFVFADDGALRRFLDSGWSGSAQADAAAKAGDKGGAYSGAAEIAPGVWVYQITKNGLALQLTLQGTKYYKDDGLNKINTSDAASSTSTPCPSITSKRSERERTSERDLSIPS
jgi:lipid-binding SYLF domain-containing protein